MGKKDTDARSLRRVGTIICIAVGAAAALALLLCVLCTNGRQTEQTGSAASDLQDSPVPAETESPQEEPTPPQGPYMSIRTENGLLPGTATHFVYATEYTENGVLSADGYPVTQTLADLEAPANDPTAVPQFSLDANWEVVPCDGSVTVKGVEVFNRQLDRLYEIGSVDQLSSLAPGTYYLCFECLWTGSPIPDRPDHSRNRMELTIYRVTKSE